MGAYGTPEHLPPQPPKYEPVRGFEKICLHCRQMYNGYFNYCPYCGTKSGNKSPHFLSWKMVVFLLIMGWVIGTFIYNDIILFSTMQR